MKTTILTILLFSLVTVAAQTNTEVFVPSNAGGRWFRLSTNESGGAVFVYQTNGLPALNSVVPAVPVVDKFQLLLDRLTTGLATLSTLVAILLGWWGTNRAKVAQLVAPLIKSVEKKGTPELKAEIKNAAGELGLQPAMQKAVDANTAPTPEPVPPPKPATPT